MSKDSTTNAVCMKCGQQGPQKYMAHVGHNAWKCVYCLFSKGNGFERGVHANDGVHDNIEFNSIKKKGDV